MAGEKLSDSTATLVTPSPSRSKPKAEAEAELEVGPPGAPVAEVLAEEHQRDPVARFSEPPRSPHSVLA